MTKRNPNVICVPIVEQYEEKMLKPLWDIDYEEVYGKDNVRYDYYPGLDKDGNVVTKVDVYVLKERVRFMWKKKKTSAKAMLKLFPPQSELEEERKKNGKKIVIDEEKGWLLSNCVNHKLN